MSYQHAWRFLLMYLSLSLCPPLTFTHNSVQKLYLEICPCLRCISLQFQIADCWCNASWRSLERLYNGALERHEASFVQSNDFVRANFCVICLWSPDNHLWLRVRGPNGGRCSHSDNISQGYVLFSSRFWQQPFFNRDTSRTWTFAAFCLFLVPFWQESLFSYYSQAFFSAITVWECRNWSFVFVWYFSSCRHQSQSCWAAEYGTRLGQGWHRTEKYPGVWTALAGETEGLQRWCQYIILCTRGIFDTIKLCVVAGLKVLRHNPWF